MDTKKHKSDHVYTNIFHRLPLDVVYMIFRTIGRPLDLIRIKRTCKLFNECITSDKVCSETIEKVKLDRFNIKSLMIKASKDGDIELVRFCVSKGAYHWNHGIIAAIEGHHDTLIDYFRDRGANNWGLILDAAISAGNRKLIDEMMNEKGAKLDMFSVRNAAEANNLEFVELGIKTDINANWNDALYGAARGGHKELIDLCVERGANNWGDGLRGVVSGGHLELIDFFVGKGAAIDDLCIREAILNGHEMLANVLLANVGTLDDKQLNWCLQDSARVGSMKFVKLFVQKGANDLDMAMRCAALRRDLEMIDYLIDAGASDWEDGLCSAISGGHRDLIEFFMGKGAIINVNCIQEAIISGHDTLACELLEKAKHLYGHELNICLGNAVTTRNLDLVKLLVQKGVDAFDEAMKTAVYIANLVIIKYLVDSGAPCPDEDLLDDNHCFKPILVEYIKEKRNEKQ